VPAAPDRGWRAVADTALAVRDRWPLHGLTPLPLAAPVTTTGEPPPACLVGTSAVGLLHLRTNDGARRLLDGGWYYGLTTAQGRWFVFERTSSRGRVVCFALDGTDGVRTLVWGLHFGVHQIDVVDGRLLVLDTHANRLLAYGTAPGRPRWWSRTARQALPAGALDRGRGSANYAHFNSVFADEAAVHLVAHNASTRTGRPSELYRLDHGLRLLDVRPLGGRDCHNYCRLQDDPRGREVHLDSAAGEVVVDGETVHRSRWFLRGLAVGRRHQLVGASERSSATSRAGGDVGDGRVLVFDAGWRHVGTVVVPGTQVFEIRLTDEPDLALSRTQLREGGQHDESRQRP
jgi:hypothetical protein